MEGNISTGCMLPGPFSVVELQGSSMHMRHPQTLIQDVFPLAVGSMHECEQPLATISEYNKEERVKTYTSDEDEPSFADGGFGFDCHGDTGKGKKGISWQRMKWTDKMVRLLITVVSYIGEDTAASDCNSGSRRKYAILQKKGKWKFVSKVMSERGYYVSPQQCEDKFNDLNKRYKRLTDILGRGTSCKVVENPALMDMMDNLTEKDKEIVRKILSSKHLFYEEMCSYHNGNRIHLPSDPALQRSLQLALRSREDEEIHDARSHLHEEAGEDDQDADTDDHEDAAEENHPNNGNIFSGPSKRLKQTHNYDEWNIGNPSTFPIDMNQVFSEGNKASYLQKQYLKSRSLQLEERKVQIQTDMLELEKQRFQWQKFSRNKDRELDMMRLENERMKLDNDHMALELKRKELEMDFC